VRTGRGTAVAGALLCVALATAGCGLGPGNGVGDVTLTVTRDYGSVPVLSRSVGGVTESDTVMRVLERNADISTRYGGGFVQSIDGVEAQDGFGHALDWFFYVNGVEATVGAAEYDLHGGEAVWWDYRDWGAAMQVPAVVGSWPEPFLDGYDGSRHPVALECRGGGAACAEASGRLEEAGVSLARGSPHDAIRVLVGPWDRVRGDPAAAQIEAGPGASGVFAQFKPLPELHQLFSLAGREVDAVREGGGYALVGLGENGKPARSFGAAAGLVAATRRYEAPPVWVVTGTTEAGVRAAAGLLDAADLRDRYAVAVEAGKETPLPLR
jgi:Domain of unknown function (DUF4430)